MLPIKRLLTSCFGLGWMPIAPGTWGSLPPMVIMGLLLQCKASIPTLCVILAVQVLVWSVVCVMLAPSAIAQTGKEDPGEIVADEAAGQAVTFLAVPLMMIGPYTPIQAWGLAGAGFLLFRVFDIIKPWPVNRLESLPRGWGILADDLMAGIYAGACLCAICFWLRP
jgi:phosphatidylglycerophosphatase A